ncbi:MAG: 4Fe-4S binding protein [Bacteroidales bacterium]|nr:4Fe-4S binding protein [Bacteroidales bacterium]
MEVILKFIFVISPRLRLGRNVLITAFLFFASTQFNYAQKKSEPNKSKVIREAFSEIVNDEKAPGIIAAIISSEGVIAIGSTTNKKLCTLCTKCIQVCPTGAITKDGSIIKTDKNKCIVCYECIKTCPVEAREMKNILFKQVNKKLYRTCKERKEPEIYF